MLGERRHRPLGGSRLMSIPPRQPRPSMPYVGRGRVSSEERSVHVSPRRPLYSGSSTATQPRRVAHSPLQLLLENVRGAFSEFGETLEESSDSPTTTAYLVIISASVAIGGAFAVAIISRIVRVTNAAVNQLAVGLAGMDGFLWLLLSWAFVGGICYLALTRLGQSSSSQSEEEAKRRQTSGSEGANGAVGSDRVEWANEISQWLFNNLHKVPEPLDAWIKSLNEAAKKVTSPTKCEILFEGFGDHSKVMEAPKLSNIRLENGPRDHLTLRSNVHLPCARLRLVSSQQTPQRMIVSNFDAQIIDLRGEVEARLACIANQLYIMGCFNGRPEMEIELTNTDPNHTIEVNRGMVEDSVRRCLLSAVTNVNLSESVMPANDRASLPRMSPMFGNSSSSFPHSPFDSPTMQYVPVQEVFKKLSDQSKLLTNQPSSSSINKLRVGVLKAARLGGLNSNVAEPFVVLEMDEPPQKYATSRSLNSNPYWEESFEFDLTPASEEILFEVYDGKRIPENQTDEKNFLGLAIVNFDELRRSGEMVHTLQLQGRPYRSDVVDGNLTCKFDFYYDPMVASPGTVTDTVTVRRNDGSEFRETVSTQRRPIYDPHDLYDGPIETIPTKTTTISVKTVAQTLKEKPAISSVHGSMEQAVDRETQRQLEQQFPEQRKAAAASTADREQQNNAASYSQSKPFNNGTSNSNVAPGNSYEEHAVMLERVSEDFAEEPRESRGREKQQNGGAKREGSFFSTLRRKLQGKRATTSRARSVDAAPTDDLEEAVSLPPSRDHSQTRWAGADGSNRRYFETTSIGGKSGESTRSLYQHSTLLLEMVEDGEKKFFLIPPNLLNEPAAARLLKRGKKLHIYNEHTFVAVKIKGGALCNVCQGRIGRSFSKQAYQCRDCKMVCHKSCHYKTDTFCTQSSVSKLHIAKDIDWSHYIDRLPLEEFISTDGV